ncbi:hypothetical protein HBB16_02390 [Pseudonocardia sp. MCCB 268]|nr:hypothetical protein [Pseudonocardia cytotoxica]
MFLVEPVRRSGRAHAGADHADERPERIVCTGAVSAPRRTSPRCSSRPAGSSSTWPPPNGTATRCCAPRRTVLAVAPGRG